MSNEVFFLGKPRGSFYHDAAPFPYPSSAGLYPFPPDSLVGSSGSALPSLISSFNYLARLEGTDSTKPSCSKYYDPFSPQQPGCIIKISSARRKGKSQGGDFQGIVHFTGSVYRTFSLNWFIYLLKQSNHIWNIRTCIVGIIRPWWRKVAQSSFHRTHFHDSHILKIYFRRCRRIFKGSRTNSTWLWISWIRKSK